MEGFHEDIRSKILPRVPVESVFHKMEDFNEDIQSKILSLVPVEYVLNCKLVCKRWRQLLSDRKVSLGIFFTFSCSPEPIIQLYYADYDVIKSTKPKEENFYKTEITKINLPPLKEERQGQVIVGSCNGLVCLALPCKGVRDPVYICNPLTSEYVILPRISNDRSWGKSWDIVSGFGYIPSTDEYKVVRILCPADRFGDPSSTTKEQVSTTKGSQVQVYTLGRGSGTGWRNITETEYSLLNEGILANDSLYWKNDKNKKIVAFGLADESFRELPPLPPCFQFPRYDERRVVYLTTLGGHLCLVDHAEDDCVDIWSFKKNRNQVNKSNYEVIEHDYYHDWSWSKDFSVEWEKDGEFLEPFALTKNNQVLIWSGSALKSYDPITKSLNLIIEREPFLKTFGGILHMNSLVSLKDLGVASKTWAGWVSKKTQPSQEE
ncbi:F-box protein At3g07870-like [Papaver somniferum]|uniref:F-box protein At3g07870-like n=1 Tax=Papaver somniferum TaxID=3469 RepID=UPI000E6F7095|nr:F-box protein At3g07870-like [Papaver somniferum]